MANSPIFDPEMADESGLVAVGGDLDPRRLLQAYRSGVFPWYDDSVPICWWSPDPRAIFELDGFHCSRRLLRTIRSGKFETTFNQAFARVMMGCANREEGTWITQDMLGAYCKLHLLGYAHSVEVWEGNELVGGLYGVSIGGMFAGESMFSRRPDASKVALAATFDRLRERGFLLFDTQVANDHTRGLGAVDIPRSVYLARLRRALRVKTVFA
jgi:leucyl/phenylalanyl-tRNA---protein transferase